MRFVNYAIIYFAIFLTFGIVAAHFFSDFTDLIINILLSCVVLLLIYERIIRRQLHQNLLFGSLAYLCFFFIGYVNYQIRLPEFQAQHYSHSISENSSKIFRLKINESLRPDLYNHKYIAEVFKVGTKETQGKIILLISKDSTNTLVKIDDCLIAIAKLTQLAKPLNPRQFDYSKYMKSLGVHHQLRIDGSNIYTTIHGKYTLKGLAERTRQYIINKLKKTPLKTEERAILQALLLGQKNDLSQETKSDYAAAGAMHILAVSGLHVGIIYLLLSFVLKPLSRFKRFLLQPIVIVSSLWLFAFIAGLSPSVTRAVTMFSFFALAKVLNRETNSLNTLFLSYFVLLLINPTWLFQVGFQLSYLAVFSILLIHPILRKYYRPKFYIDRVLWETVTVSIAVQIGIAPLTIFYFHQFPGLFFLTNMVILPLLGILLAIGIVVILLAITKILPNELGLFYNYLLETLNSFIKWVASQDNFLIDNIQFSNLKLLASYLILGSFYLLWKKQTYRRTMITLICLSGLVIIHISDAHTTTKSQFIIFHKSRESIIGYTYAKELFLFRYDSQVQLYHKYPLRSFTQGLGLHGIIPIDGPPIFKYRDKTIVILDSLGIYPNTSGVDMVLLTQSPKINLDRLIDSLQPKSIVADGSNYRSYVERWRKSCERKKLPYHHTGAMGALVIE